MNIVRLVGSALIAFVALIVLLSGKPSMNGDRISADTISAAMSDDYTNQLMTESAPQQAAANGWVARDLLEINAYQQLDMRLEILGFLGVLELCLIGATSRTAPIGRRREQGPEQARPWGVPPQKPMAAGSFGPQYVPRPFGQGMDARPTSYTPEKTEVEGTPKEMQ